MEKHAAARTNSSPFVGWEEVHVSSGKGRREVHYYLKREDGTSDLVVVGKEKGLRHMSYRYRKRSLLLLSPSSSLLKLRSRREVIDWLNSIVPDIRPHESSEPFVGSSEGSNAWKMELETMRDVQLRKLGKYTKEFRWIGSAWTCRKKRKHYPTFQRNGVKISVHDFVYVLAEEDKRLVAYLDDMYEDSRGNKMVVVRWFHKIDEVGIVLPHNYNDREIFFSLCLQNLSIECIDGLTSVLGPEHYNKFLNEAIHTQLMPFLCQSQFDNDETKPFDVTQIKGYWNQQILKYMFAIGCCPSEANLESMSIGCPLEANLKSISISGQMVEDNSNDVATIRPRKRLRRARDTEISLKSGNERNAMNACFVVPNVRDSLGGIQDCRQENSAASKKLKLFRVPMQLIVGSQVEVLSQDSGIRGCWFRALIIKKHKDKVKVRYEDIKDAADDATSLEEWILASRVAIPDELGIRISGRAIVRPTLSCSKEFVASIGSIVDVWRHDGWWEGVVVGKESADRIHVYFPGEKRESFFRIDELRTSQEWLANGWKHLNERPELVTGILSSLEKNHVVKSLTTKLDQSVVDKVVIKTADRDSLSTELEVQTSSSNVESGAEHVRDKDALRVISKDDFLAELKWNCSRKRKNRSTSARKLHYRVVNCTKKNRSIRSSTSVLGTCEKFFIRLALKVDSENCSKYRGDPLFSSVVSSLTNLVMSQ